MSSTYTCLNGDTQASLVIYSGFYCSGNVLHSEIYESAANTTTVCSAQECEYAHYRIYDKTDCAQSGNYNEGTIIYYYPFTLL